MRVVTKGDIVDFVPFFNASLDEDGRLAISKDGDYLLTVDTGFSGGIALPLDILNTIDVELAFYDTFKLATGEVIELPVFLGKVGVGKYEVETWFIPGDFLLGMEFLSLAGSRLSFDFEKDEVKLLG
jgi:predicted aspartyl protease